MPAGVKQIIFSQGFFFFLFFFLGGGGEEGSRGDIGGSGENKLIDSPGASHQVLTISPKKVINFFYYRRL